MPVATPAPQQVPANSEGDRPSSGESAGQPLTAAANGSSSFWPWLSLALALAWLVTLFAWLRSRQRPPGDAVTGKVQTNEKQLLNDLQAACEGHDAPTAKTLLLQWAALQWPGNHINSLGELAAQFDGELQLELHRLSQHLYSRNAAGWNGTQVWHAFAARPQRLSEKVTAQPALEPLYR